VGHSWVHMLVALKDYRARAGYVESAISRQKYFGRVRYSASGHWFKSSLVHTSEGVVNCSSRKARPLG